MGACHSQEREPWETAHKTEPSCQAWRLVDRVAAARTARQANRSTIPLPLAPGSQVSAHMVVCPRAARETFAEDCDALSKSRGRCAALTAVNGDAWRSAPAGAGGRRAVAHVACRRRGRRGRLDGTAAGHRRRARGRFTRGHGVRCRCDGGLPGRGARTRRRGDFRAVARAGALPSDARRGRARRKRLAGGERRRPARGAAAGMRGRWLRRRRGRRQAHRALLAGAQTCATLARRSRSCRPPPREPRRVPRSVKHSDSTARRHAAAARRDALDVGGGIGRGAWVVGDLVACAHRGDATSLRTTLGGPPTGTRRRGASDRALPRGPTSRPARRRGLGADARAAWRLARKRDWPGPDGTCGSGAKRLRADAGVSPAGAARRRRETLRPPDGATRNYTGWG